MTLETMRNVCGTRTEDAQMFEEISGRSIRLPSNRRSIRVQCHDARQNDLLRTDLSDALHRSGGYLVVRNMQGPLTTEAKRRAETDEILQHAYLRQAAQRGLAAAHEEAARTLRKHRETLREVADVLLAHRQIDGREVDRILHRQPPASSALSQAARTTAKDSPPQPSRPEDASTKDSKSIISKDSSVKALGCHGRRSARKPLAGRHSRPPRPGPQT